MRSGPPIPVGVRLPLAGKTLSPRDLIMICRTARELGYSSFWVGDHVVLPESTSSVYPHTGSGRQPFRTHTPWLDPLVQLSWIAGQVPGAGLGTSVLVATLRNPTLLAKQITSLSWLAERPLSLGIGTGWLREEYDAIDVPFEKRARRARSDIALMKELIARGGRTYTVRDADGEPVDRAFTMLPTAPAPVEFLWGGHSPLAMRLAATVCDGWLPAKQSVEDLQAHLVRLRRACDDVHRDFAELKLVVKPGPGPDPRSGRVDADGLAAYSEMGFHEAILEMPYEADEKDLIQVLERIAHRSWL